MTHNPQITPERLGDANKTIITPEWIAERRANIEEVEKRFWHRNLYIINGQKIYDGAKLSFLVEEDLPALTQGFRVALDRIEELSRLKDFFEADSKFIRKDWEETNEKLSEAREEIKKLRLCMLDALGPLDGGPSTCCEGASAEFSYAVDALKRGLNEK